ncbi:MAG TPA: copper amine oxidase N-terminal domain-containing protein [Sporosarcina psychrophila]|uniref:Copper amine oxidase N-terminal domain-containing protein n=1 Tax=Sporosarcina psychrophila TaxID=1476 RepID=A0A921FVY4_SPOPS|nr:copper amine oxidase N-terminal domain-containing protein [Sporosarcina psychrophila]
MKKIKFVPFAMTALLLGGATVAPTTFADEAPTEEMEVQPVFIKIAGTIDNVDVRDNATYYTMKDGGNINVLAVTADTLVFDNTGKKVELKKGDKVEAHTFANKPMLAIYPPQYSPEVVIVKTEAMGEATVGTFDKDLLDANLSLKLNVSEETELSSLSGKEVKITDLADQNLLVFYTITTMSIPAQTPPSKVVVLDQKEADQEAPGDSVIEEIIANDFYDVDGTKMVPLRLLVEELGYKVKSTGKGAIISKGALSYTITRGEKTYGYNKALLNFDVAPALLEPMKTYVPVEFIRELIK